MPLGEPFMPQPSAELILSEMGIQKTSELPHIIPPLPTGDTKDLKVWKEYWMQHDAYIRKDEREKVLDELCKIEKTAQCLCETCRMTVEQCRGQQLRQHNPQPPCPKYKVWQYCMVAVEMRSNILMEVVQKVRHLIREEGYDCGEAERILTFLKEMK